jgi:hypothetical protein
MAALVVRPLPGAGLGARVFAWVRGMRVRRLLQRLSGVPTVVLEGRVCTVRARPLRVCRDLVPALVRCSRRFSSLDFDEALYDDLVIVLSLGLNVPATVIERLTVPLWDLVPVIERIAQVNGLPVMEAGRADLGELLTMMAATSTGTSTAPSSSAQPAGPGHTSTTN